MSSATHICFFRLSLSNLTCHGPADRSDLPLHVPHAGLSGVRSNDQFQRLIIEFEQISVQSVFVELL